MYHKYTKKLRRRYRNPKAPYLSSRTAESVERADFVGEGQGDVTRSAAVRRIYRGQSDTLLD